MTEVKRMSRMERLHRKKYMEVWRGWLNKTSRTMRVFPEIIKIYKTKNIIKRKIFSSWMEENPLSTNSTTVWFSQRRVTMAWPP